MDNSWLKSKVCSQLSAEGKLSITMVADITHKLFIDILPLLLKKLMLWRFSAFLLAYVNLRAIFNVTFQFTTKWNTLTDLLGIQTTVRCQTKTVIWKFKILFWKLYLEKRIQTSMFFLFFLDISKAPRGMQCVPREVRNLNF